MNTAQLPFLVEGILMLTAGTFGILLGRAGKPYGKVKLVVHLFFVLWFSVGFGFITYGILTMSSATKGIWIPVAVMGLAILTQLVTGISDVGLQESRNGVYEDPLIFGDFDGPIRYLCFHHGRASFIRKWGNRPRFPHSIFFANLFESYHLTIFEVEVLPCLSLILT